MAVAFQDALPDAEVWETNRWLLAERFGWTLDYIDGLDDLEMARGQAIMGAIDAGRQHVQRREARKGSGKGRKR